VPISVEQLASEKVLTVETPVLASPMIETAVVVLGELGTIAE
jgi:hypothetical protein